MKIRELAVQVKDRYRQRMAVKEALDTLPTAVCYFNASGTVKLCNRMMRELFRKITQSDLQSLGELQEALAGCDRATGVIRDGNVFLFPDGTAWQYAEEKVKTAGGSTYTEAVLSDVTKLYEKRRELQKQSKELKKMNQELKSLAAHMQEMTREQEILSLKSRLHDQMNMGVAAIRQMLRQNSALEENAAALQQFCRAIQIWQEENEEPQDALEDALEEFQQDAAVSGILVSMTGEFTNIETLQPLVVQIMREACVNAARHADAARLWVAAEQSHNAFTLRMTNDGRTPEKEVTPRGGLVDLGKEIAAAGGQMKIQSFPTFELAVTLPIRH